MTGGSISAPSDSAIGGMKTAASSMRGSSSKNSRRRSGRRRSRRCFMTYALTVAPLVGGNTIAPSGQGFAWYGQQRPGLPRPDEYVPLPDTDPGLHHRLASAGDRARGVRIRPGGGGNRSDTAGSRHPIGWDDVLLDGQYVINQSLIRTSWRVCSQRSAWRPFYRANRDLGADLQDRVPALCGQYVPDRALIRLRCSLKNM